MASHAGPHEEGARVGQEAERGGENGPETIVVFAGGSGLSGI